jgi:methionyl-tRNA synthetase
MGRILVCAAWPYANNEPHLGHYAGNLLPADVFARAQRLKGHQVLFVSGSDAHGTPIMVKADSEGVKPATIVARYHEKFIESFEKMGISFDLYTATNTQTHHETAQELFLGHKAKGWLYTEVQEQLFDPTSGRFLPDRYVEGTCPFCGFTDARGDQCDNCNKTYEPTALKNPRSKISGSTQLEVRKTEHFFFDLGKANEPLLKWINDDHKGHWRKPVLNCTRALLEKKELRGRPITRDLDWGVPVPVPGFESKRLYVWYDAVMGYLSATKEWATLSGNPKAWHDWWDEGSDTRSWYFMGKDNIEFHTVMWPAELVAFGGLKLPWDVPAAEFLNSAGRKFSKSRGTAIFMLNVLERYQVDAWRYVLTALAPETGDSDFTWDDFVERVNSELVANWGNLANRVLGFASKRYEGCVPTPGPLGERETKLLDEIRSGFDSVGRLYDSAKLRSALEETRALCQKVNQYLSDVAPWTLIKTDAQGAATSIWVALQCIDWLAVMWSPVLVESSEHIRQMLGRSGRIAGTMQRQTVTDKMGEHLVLRYDGSNSQGRWQADPLEPGTKLGEISAPFRKLDEKVAELESPKETP